MTRCHRPINSADLEAVKAAAVAEHKPIERAGSFGPIDVFATARECEVVDVVEFDRVYSASPDHIGTVEVTYSPQGARALYAVTDEGGTVLYAN